MKWALYQVLASIKENAKWPLCTRRFIGSRKEVATLSSSSQYCEVVTVELKKVE